MWGEGGGLRDTTGSVLHHRIGYHTVLESLYAGL